MKKYKVHILTGTKVEELEVPAHNYIVNHQGWIQFFDTEGLNVATYKDFIVVELMP